ncbi:porin family protein [Fodinibius halophilus]|uniref:PorT family protein n=1 Tax=Fodinibius halophilus TaxID=1736908 RepID=A0A6M1TLF4_9BACT|nr:porin family protein [Fodinibius halophilus]NGP89290.1 PorT family protein [Fodinibius halophilus]
MQVNTQKVLGLTFIHLLVFLVWAGITANAQTTTPLHWGVKAGINASTMHGDAVDDAEYQAGFNGGIYLNYKFAQNWSIQPEVLFSMKGAETESSLSGQAITTDYELGYLSIPVLAKYHFNTNSNVIPSLYLGPQLGFGLYGDANDNEIDDSLADAEFGLAFGGGIDLLTASQASDLIQLVGLDLRYTLGLTDTFDVAGDPEAQNGAFSAVFTLGF